jgi:uncharacterized protein YhaN
MVKARWRTGWRETMNLVESLNERDRLRQEREWMLEALKEIAKKYPDSVSAKIARAALRQVEGRRGAA